MNNISKPTPREENGWCTEASITFCPNGKDSRWSVGAFDWRPNCSEIHIVAYFRLADILPIPNLTHKHGKRKV